MEDIMSAVEAEQRKKAALLNFEQKGSLGVTASDYHAIGGDAEDILENNPGKTLSELMTPEEILHYLTQTEINIQENEGLEKMKNFNADLKNNLNVTVRYLREIGKLPDTYIQKVN